MGPISRVARLAQTVVRDSLAAGRVAGRWPRPQQVRSSPPFIVVLVWNNFCEFCFGFCGSKSPRCEEEQERKVDAADHLSLLDLPSVNLPSPSLPSSSIKSRRVLSARSPIVCAFLLFLSLFYPFLAGVFESRRHLWSSPGRSSPFVPFLPAGTLSPLPTHGPPSQPTSPKPRRFLQRHIASSLCPARIINLSISIGAETGVPYRTIFAAATAPSSR